MRVSSRFVRFLLPLIWLLACGADGLSRAECEVCVKVLEKFDAQLTPTQKSDTGAIEEAFKEFCRGLRGKESRFCYYVGGLEDSATRTLRELAQPVQWGMPPEKICERLRKNNPQICEMKYPKKMDLRGVNLKRLKVGELKRILHEWEEECEACIEKIDFIRRIEELKPLHGKDEF